MVPLVYCSLPVHPSSLITLSSPSTKALLHLRLSWFISATFEMCLYLIHLLFCCISVSSYLPSSSSSSPAACCYSFISQLFLFSHSLTLPLSSSNKKAQSMTGRMAAHQGDEEKKNNRLRFGWAAAVATPEPSHCHWTAHNKPVQPSLTRYLWPMISNCKQALANLNQAVALRCKSLGSVLHSPT